MIKRPGKIERGLIIMGSAAGSIGDLALGMWRGGSSKRWVLPIAVFLCVMGMMLALAASVEALAPFIYSVF